jgi:hypothetical protein
VRNFEDACTCWYFHATHSGAFGATGDVSDKDVSFCGRVLDVFCDSCFGVGFALRSRKTKLNRCFGGLSNTPTCINGSYSPTKPIVYHLSASSQEKGRLHNLATLP